MQRAHKKIEMSLTLPWWRKVREADIRKSSRDIFERFGEGIVADIVSASHAPRAPDLIAMYTNEQMINAAAAWLTERGDEKVLHEQRIEFVEWAILVFVIVGVFLDLLLLFHAR